MSDLVPAFIPEPLKVPYSKAKALFGKLTRPMRILIGASLVALLLIGGYVSVRSSYEPYAVLYASLDREDAAALVAKLKELKTPYRLTADGTSIEVPEAKVHELRLDLASAGLPRGGGVGFESFDKLRLGATEYEQKVLYRRALEGELARTISSIGAVQAARVHLVLPEKSVFVSKQEASTASIVVKFRPGRTFGAGEISGIVHMIASSVSGLTADRITLVTSDGQMLHRPKGTNGESGGDDEGGENVSHAQKLERDLEERAKKMLERVVGAGHVDVRVTADIDSSRVERIEDHYDPTKAALRSEEASTERTTTGNNTVAGVPGAESNLPTGSAPVAVTTDSSGVIRESHTRNFEMDHVFEKKIATTGTLKRLTVAVVLDGIAKTENGHVTHQEPRGKEEMDRLSSLVKSAVGIDEKRGDVLTLDSVPFLEADPFVVEEAPVTSPIAELKKLEWKKPKVYIPAAVLGVLVLGALVAVLRKVKKANKLAALKPSLSLTISDNGTTGEIPAVLGVANSPLRLPPPEVIEPDMDLRETAQVRASADPATAALVLRAWLGAADNREPAIAAE